MSDTTQAGSAFPVHQVPPVPASVGTRIQAAVGDATHAMLLTYDMSDGEDPGDHIAASVVATNGDSRPVELPDLQSPTLVPRPRGYAVGGVHCQKVHMDREENICDHGVPVVVFLDAAGVMNGMTVVPGVTDAVPASVTTVSSGEGVVMRADEKHWFTVNPDGVEELPATPGVGTLCRLRDGTLIAAAFASQSTDPGDADSSPGEMQLWSLAGGAWEGPFRRIPYGKYSFPSTNCVPGGLVTDVGTITQKDNFTAPTPLPSDIPRATAGMTTARAIGFDLSGRLYLSQPPSMNKAPQVLGDGSASAKIVPSDRWIGVSSDGTYLAIGATASDLRIERAT